ncbi:hypothetical protein LIER_29455 [Lithospermum erythrorhizon]|uniref:Uncharacterized protein n=1 Tax=Lithospermum erythrorhizon TaxID=34254 RepID=A0AAV3RJP2_LITER
MVGYREDAHFLLEAYNPHHFPKQLCFFPAIPGFKSRSRDIVLASEDLRYWRSYITTRLRQSVTFPSKSAPRLPSPPVPFSSKPLRKRSLPEDDPVDRDPKHAKWGNTRRPGHVVMFSPDAHIAVTKDVEATPLSEIVPSSGDEA